MQQAAARHTNNPAPIILDRILARLRCEKRVPPEFREMGQKYPGLSRLH
jgi:hypothetical protein